MRSLLVGPRRLRYNPYTMWASGRTFGPGHSSATGLAVPVALFLLVSGSCSSFASSEKAYAKSVAQYKPVEVVSGPQVQQARRAEPGRALQVSGVIQGAFASGEDHTILLELVDKTTVEIEGVKPTQEAHPRARVCCLVKPAQPSPTAPLLLVDITWDKTPIELLQEAARAALKIPVKDREEIARSAAEVSRTQPFPTRGGDQETVCKRAISYLNPKLSSGDVNTIAASIMSYSTRYSVDPYLIVAVIAAESRFNPNARSYKGAMGLGQLMPATAAAHNVNAYDPIDNLQVAIRILRRNLDKYHGDWNKALAAYNAGCGAVDRHQGVPPYRETRNYLWKIYEYWCWLNGVTPQPRPR